MLSSLKELIQWCKSQQQQIVIKKQFLQPDLNITSKQINENKVFMCNIEYKKSIIESTLASAKLYYDDRVKNIEMTTVSINEEVASANNNIMTHSSSLILSNLKRKLSSKKIKKDKKSSFQELKIKEENETDLNADADIADQFDDDDALDEEIDLLAKNQMSPTEIADHLVNKIDR